MFNQWLRQRKVYWWWVPDVSKLNEESILEGIMSYGDWEDFLQLKKLWGTAKITKIFDKITGKKRVNLRPSTRALFSDYLATHAS